MCKGKKNRMGQYGERERKKKKREAEREVISKTTSLRPGEYICQALMRWTFP